MDQPGMAVRRRGSSPDVVLFHSFGGAIAASLARRLGPRVTHLCLVSPEPRKC